MENQEVRNEEGQLVLPQSQYNPIDPVNGAVYVKDELYEERRGLQAQGNQEVTTTEPAGQDVTQADPATVVTQGPDPDQSGNDLAKLIEDRTGGKYKAIEDILAELDKKNKDPELPEVSRKLYDALVNGNESEILEVLYKKQVLNGASKLADADAIKLAMQLEHEADGWTPEDVDDEFELVYGIKADKDDMDPDEYAKIERRNQRRLMEKAKEARQFLEAQAASIKIPEFGSRSEDTGVDPDTEALVKQYDQWSLDLQRAPEDIKNLSKIEFSLNDKDVQFSHEYQIDETEKADLASKVSDYWGWMKSRYAKDGKLDTQKLAKDIFKLENEEKIQRSQITRAINLGKVAVVKGVAHVQSPGVSIPSTPADDAARAALSAFILR